MKKPRAEVWVITWSPSMRLKRPYEVRIVDAESEGMDAVALARFGSLLAAEERAERVAKALGVALKQRPTPSGRPDSHG